MPERNDPAEEITALMAAARRMPHNFVMMKTKDGVAIEAHKTKEVQSLVPLVKAKGGMPAIGCSGIMTVQGRLIDLAVDDPDVPGTLPLLAKRYFKSIGVMAKVQITLPGGEVIGDGEEGDEDEGEQDGVPPDAPPVSGETVADSGDERKAALKERLQNLLPAIRAASEKAVPGVDRLVQAIRNAGAMVAAGSYDEAEKVIALVERAAQQLQGPPDSGTTGTPPEDDAAALMAALRGLVARIGAIPDAERKQMLARLATAGGAALKSGDLAAAAARIAELRAALDVAPQEGQKAQPLLPVWRDAREAVNAQLDQLQTAMRNHGMPLFARIADKGLNGVTERHLVPLQAALMDADRAAGEARVAAAALVRRRIEEMRGFLTSNPVLPLLEGNPLKVPVAIRATLGAALDDIARTLPT